MVPVSFGFVLVRVRVPESSVAASGKLSQWPLQFFFFSYNSAMLFVTKSKSSLGRKGPPQSWCLICMESSSIFDIFRPAGSNELLQ